MSRTRKASFIAGFALATSLIVGSVAYTGVNLTKYMLEHGSSINEAMKSAIEFAGNGLVGPAKGTAPSPDLHLVMGYNKDKDPLQVWRVAERKKLADGSETGVIVTEKGLRHPITAYRVDG